MEELTMSTYLPKSAYLEPGATAPEGTVLKTCSCCKQNFAVGPEFQDATECEVCAKAAADAAAVADMKSATANVIKS